MTLPFVLRAGSIDQFCSRLPNRGTHGRDADRALGDRSVGTTLETMVIHRPSLTLAAEMLSAAMVLAAGLGTRLRPLTEWCAKPLVPVGDQPALGHVLAQLRAAGIARLVVNAHHRLADMRAFAKETPDISVSEEPDLLGTAGGVAHALGRLGSGDVLVYNADTFAQIDLRALADAHAGDEERATLVVRARAPGQGSVGLDENQRLVRLRNERIRTEAYGGDFLGVQVIGAALLRRLPRRGCLVGDTYIHALHRGFDLRAFLHPGPSFDIGTPRGYLDANLAWLAARGTSHWAGAGARIDPQVAVAETILGAGAAASGRGTISRCVVWPGATARAPVADAVVTIENVVLVRNDR
jgi:mannose-1-phosphate guanylyltransferase